MYLIAVYKNLLKCYEHDTMLLLAGIIHDI